MNKTININLAGIFFHVDEDAYIKLQNYLEAVKRSFANEEGNDEILSDIEARIAELFNERIQNERQVVGMKEVDDIIEIMGQPEDYNVDGTAYDEANTATNETSKQNNKTKAPKQLFRDPLNSYAGGVSSGLGYYLGIDPVWVRLLWVLLTVFSSGAFILIYLALWIFVPKAETTAERLAMQGEPINISNIEKKIKEGFDEVSGKVKSSSPAISESISDILKFLLKLFVKAIGVLLIIISGFTIIGLFIGLFGVTVFNIIDFPWRSHMMVSFSIVPSWVYMLLSLFVVGIPFFFLFILGMKILVENLKSIGRTTKLVLLALWIISILTLIFLGIKQATSHAYDAKVTKSEVLPITATDTLTVRMIENNLFVNQLEKNGGFELRTNENGEKMIVTQDITIYIKSVTNQTPLIKITKEAEGSSYEDAKKRAKNIQYNYTISGNDLLLDSHALSNMEDKYRDQEVKITLLLPIGMTLYADKNTASFNSWSTRNSLPVRNKEGHYLLIENNSVKCDTCPFDTDESEWDDDKNQWKIRSQVDDDEGINIDINGNNKERFNLKIDKNGIRINNEPVEIKINEDGINIESED